MTMKKFIGTISAALAATALTASAGVDVDIVSAYVWRGVTLSEEAQVQPGFETEILGGLATFGTWGSFDLDESQFIEIDYYLEIPLPLGEDSPVTADFIYTEYTFPGAEGDAEREIGLAFGTDVGEIGLGLGLFYGVGGGADGTLYIELSAEYGMALAENIDLGLSAVLHYWDIDGGESGFNAATLGASLDLVIPEIEFPITVGINYVIEIDDDVAEVEEDLFFTLGFSL